ncbi:podocalyxin-like protein 2 [Oncorhynchus mykiss]|uniref:Podocalyxin-like protein 2 n=1 Tax=Oncorhynchus mykiss TaxID=8022 RepID=A0A8C7SNV3_ONCMY|nr:podocalyxin-like protein 2 [Oncorhynchus mykiss]
MVGLLRPLLFGSTLFFLLSCDALLSDGMGPPTLLSTSQPSPLSLMDQDVEEQPERMTVPGSPTTVPGLTSQGQESSGLFNDDNKPLQSSVHLWDDVRDQVNITGLDRKSLRGYSQTLSQTSTSPMEEPRQGNHTSPFKDAVERQERELWEMERESSGLPLEAGYGQNQSMPTTTSNTTTSNTTTSNTTTSNTTTSNTPTSNTPTSNTTTSNTTTTPTSNTPTTPAADPLVPVDSTTLDPQYVPVYGGSQSTPEDTVEVDVADEEEEEEEERESSTPEPDASTSRPTLPEVGVFPSLGPLQSDNTHTEDQEEEEEEEEEAVVLGRPRSESGRAGRGGDISPLTTAPLASLAPTVDVTEDSALRLEDEEMFAGKEIQEKERRQEEEKKHDEEEQEVRHGGKELLTEAELLRGAHFSQEIQQVICVDWSDLAGKGYVILNMSDNVDCDEFRVESGDRLLELLETTFSRKMNSPQGSWLISLSKPTRQDHQLLVTLANEHGVIATKDMLSMLGEIRRGLHEIGIQNYSSANTCHSRPSQTRSDYGKLFVVLVIIGSVCVVIIASGLIYIFWQRRLPKIKTMTRGEEFHFVENGCHDNPTLDVTSDGGGQPEIQEKKHRHANGLTAGSGGEGGSSGWQVLVNKPGVKEEDNMEEDTHL